MQKSQRRIMQSYSDRIFDVTNYSLLFIILVIYIFPLIFVVSASISNPDAVWGGKVWLLPKDITLEGYRRILRFDNIWNGYKNSIIYAVTGTLLNLFMTVTAAYSLSRKDFYIRNILMGIYAFTLFFGGGLIPTYLLVKKLGMVNTIWAMIVPNAVALTNVIVTRTYFQTSIPDELREAASLDGCSNLKFLIKIVLPLSVPIIAVMALFYAVGHWNSYFNALIYLNDRKKHPLQLVLRDILVLNMTHEMMDADKSVLEQLRLAETIKYGVIIVSSLPVLLVYPLVQKHFVKGVMIGSIKG
jgi:putative aldouronate transport system permease protein